MNRYQRPQAGLNLLLRERTTVRRARQRDCLAAFAVYVINVSVRAADMAQPDQRPAAVVRD
jgi:hypothetical protein